MIQPLDSGEMFKRYDAARNRTGSEWYEQRDVWFLEGYTASSNDRKVWLLQIFEDCVRDGLNKHDSLTAMKINSTVDGAKRESIDHIDETLQKCHSDRKRLLFRTSTFRMWLEGMDEFRELVDTSRGQDERDDAAEHLAWIDAMIDVLRPDRQAEISNLVNEVVRDAGTSWPHITELENTQKTQLENRAEWTTDLYNGILEGATTVYRTDPSDRRWSWSTEEYMFLLYVLSHCINDKNLMTLSKELAGKYLDPSTMTRINKSLGNESNEETGDDTPPPLEPDSDTEEVPPLDQSNQPRGSISGMLRYEGTGMGGSSGIQVPSGCQSMQISHVDVGAKNTISSIAIALLGISYSDAYGGTPGMEVPKHPGPLEPLKRSNGNNGNPTFFSTSLAPTANSGQTKYCVVDTSFAKSLVEDDTYYRPLKHKLQSTGVVNTLGACASDAYRRINMVLDGQYDISYGTKYVPLKCAGVVIMHLDRQVIFEVKDGAGSSRRLYERPLYVHMAIQRHIQENTAKIEKVSESTPSWFSWRNKTESVNEYKMNVATLAAMEQITEFMFFVERDNFVDATRHVFSLDPTRPSLTRKYTSMVPLNMFDFLRENGKNPSLDGGINTVVVNRDALRVFRNALRSDDGGLEAFINGAISAIDNQSTGRYDYQVKLLKYVLEDNLKKFENAVWESIPQELKDKNGRQDWRVYQDLEHVLVGVAQLILYYIYNTKRLDSYALFFDESTVREGPWYNEGGLQQVDDDFKGETVVIDDVVYALEKTTSEAPDTSNSLAVFNDVKSLTEQLADRLEVLETVDRDLVVEKAARLMKKLGYKDDDTYDGPFGKYDQETPWSKVMRQQIFADVYRDIEMEFPRNVGELGEPKISLPLTIWGGLRRNNSEIVKHSELARMATDHLKEKFYLMNRIDEIEDFIKVFSPQSNHANTHTKWTVGYTLKSAIPGDLDTNPVLSTSEYVESLLRPYWGQTSYLWGWPNPFPTLESGVPFGHLGTGVAVRKQLNDYNRRRKVTPLPPPSAPPVPSSTDSTSVPPSSAPSVPDSKASTSSVPDSKASTSVPPSSAPSVPSSTASTSGPPPSEPPLDVDEWMFIRLLKNLLESAIAFGDIFPILATVFGTLKSVYNPRMASKYVDYALRYAMELGSKEASQRVSSRSATVKKHSRHTMDVPSTRTLNHVSSYMNLDKQRVTELATNRIFDSVYSGLTFAAETETDAMYLDVMPVDFKMCNVKGIEHVSDAVKYCICSGKIAHVLPDDDVHSTVTSPRTTYPPGCLNNMIENEGELPVSSTLSTYHGTSTGHEIRSYTSHSTPRKRTSEESYDVLTMHTPSVVRWIPFKRIDTDKTSDLDTLHLEAYPKDSDTQKLIESLCNVYVYEEVIRRVRSRGNRLMAAAKIKQLQFLCGVRARSNILRELTASSWKLPTMFRAGENVLEKSILMTTNPKLTTVYGKEYYECSGGVTAFVVHDVTGPDKIGNTDKDTSIRAESKLVSYANQSLYNVAKSSHYGHVDPWKFCEVKSVYTDTSDKTPLQKLPSTSVGNEPATACCGAPCFSAYSTEAARSKYSMGASAMNVPNAAGNPISCSGTYVRQPDIGPSASQDTQAADENIPPYVPCTFTTNDTSRTFVAPPWWSLGCFERYPDGVASGDHIPPRRDTMPHDTSVLSVDNILLNLEQIKGGLVHNQRQIKEMTKEKRMRLAELNKRHDARIRDVEIVYKDVEREVDVSKDPLWRFTKMFSGLTSETVQKLTTFDDAPAVASQKEQLKQERKLVEAARQTHLRMVDAFFRSVLKDGGMQLNVRRVEDGSEVRVVPTEARKRAADLMNRTAQAGGFFNNSAAIEKMVAESDVDLTLEDMVGRLNDVGGLLITHALQQASSNERRSDSMADSMDYMLHPKNCRVLQWNSDAAASIKSSHRLFQTEWRRSRQRPVTMYELLEGEDNELSHAFATLCARFHSHARLVNPSNVGFVTQSALASAGFAVRGSLNALVRAAERYVRTYKSPWDYTSYEEFHQKRLRSL